MITRVTIDAMLDLYTTQAYPFKLSELAYDYDGLEPSIDARTMQIHHDKHPAGYLKNRWKVVNWEVAFLR